MRDSRSRLTPRAVKQRIAPTRSTLLLDNTCGTLVPAESVQGQLYVGMKKNRICTSGAQVNKHTQRHAVRTLPTVFPRCIMYYFTIAHLEFRLFSDETKRNRILPRKLKFVDPKFYKDAWIFPVPV